jgi:hypothetical protein
MKIYIKIIVAVILFYVLLWTLWIYMMREKSPQSNAVQEAVKHETRYRIPTIRAKKNRILEYQNEVQPVENNEKTDLRVKK